jgi:predicted nucleotidyltransferase
MSRHQSIRDIAEVARRLGELAHEVVFLGGAAVPLMVPEAVAPTIRPTADVDCVVRAESYPDYANFGERLRQMGFEECREEGAPICRWTTAGVLVDVMPTGDCLGFFNSWYRHVIDTSEEVDLAPDVRVRIASLPAFLATKFEALMGRGGDDYVANADFEDIVTILGTREDALERIGAAPVDLRQFLSDCSRVLLKRKDLEDLVSGCFPGDAISQASVPRAVAGFRALARVPQEQ